MNLQQEFRDRQASNRRALELRRRIAIARHEAEDADHRTPLEKLADAVHRPAPPSTSTNPDFNRAIRRLASPDKETDE